MKNTETQQTAVEQIINKIDEMQKRYIDYGKQNKSLKKQVDAVLTATTLLKMDCIDIKEIEHKQIQKLKDEISDLENQILEMGERD
jgi:hypothetical protein